MDFEHYLLDTLFYLPVILPYCICHFHSCQLGTCQSFSASISPENPNIFLHPPVTSYRQMIRILSRFPLTAFLRMPLLRLSHPNTWTLLPRAAMLLSHLYALPAHRHHLYFPPLHWLYLHFWTVFHPWSCQVFPPHFHTGEMYYHITFSLTKELFMTQLCFCLLIKLAYL